VQGATVGPADFTFTTASDVIRLRDVPPEFSAVLSGHIHRHQVLMRDLEQRALRAPVLYPGSIERTSFAEVGEPKGFMVVRFSEGELEWEFRRLPARPMIRHELSADRLSAVELGLAVRAIVRVTPADAVVLIRVSGALTSEHWRALSPATLRAFVPETMNVEISPVDGFVGRSAAPHEEVLRRLRGHQDDPSSAQLSFY
jgi:DNA repair exonuclease SbcCD nuclease subunit